MPKSALIFGASGLVGGQLLRCLLDANDYNQVTALGRAKLPIVHPKLIQKVINFNELTNWQADFAVDDVFCCLGTTIKKAKSREAFRQVDFYYPLTIARLAQQADARQFLVISAVGASCSSPFFYNKVKGEMEEAVKKLSFPALHIFRPSLLLGDRQEFRLGESIAALVLPFFSRLLIGPLRKYRPITAAAVAHAMYRVAQENKRGAFIYQSDEIARLGAGK